MSLVRTVLGDIPAVDLGRTNYHEHLFQVTPLLPGDELDDERLSHDEAGRLVVSGLDAMVDATPVGLARNPQAVARISDATKLHIVGTTGAHHGGHYPDSHWVRQLSETKLTEYFVSDVESGMCVHDTEVRPETARYDGRPIRAGMLKAGIGYWSISPFERRVLGAVAAAHSSTGAPVMVHLEFGSAAFEVLEILARDGVPSSAVVLAHIDRNPDPFLHADLAAAGAYLGYDGFARTRNWPDSMLIDCAVRAAQMGAAERIVIGGDVARRSRYIAYGGMPGLEYLGSRAIPALGAAAGAELAAMFLSDNPARLLARFRPVRTGG